ncbi:MAG: hypothetical protein MUP63_04000, partial [Candidatus Nanohaloarchaeota archaeon QJJ-7]|nr:hypothetical protein [Candidatus Nanohaloarchaeota archaeon QJJ-7]
MGENVHAGVGASDASEAEEAAEEAVDSAIENFKEDGGEVPELGMVFTHGSNFGGKKKNFEHFAEKVENRLGGEEETDWMGGTSAGEIIQGDLKEKSTVVVLLSSEYLDFGIGIYNGVRSNPREGGKEGISSALDDLGTDEYLNPYLKYLASKQKDSAESFNTYEYFVMAISPGLKLSGPGKEDEVVEGIFDVTGRRVPIVGGTTVHPGLRENYQFYNGELYEDALIVVAGSSGLKIGFSFAHGYQSTEHRGICTSSQDYVIEEIDGEDAINRYADMMDTTADDLWDT